MSNTLPLDDDELLERLRRLASANDPMPTDLVAAAKAAFGLRSLDDELAELTFDSLFDDALVGVRGQTSRQLTFGLEDVAIDVDLDGDELVGQITPTTVAAVALQTPTATIDLPLDERGRFFTARPPGNAFRLRIDIGTQRITTEWVSL